MTKTYSLCRLLSHQDLLGNGFCLLYRYLNTHLSSTLTVIWEGKPVRELKSKLCCYLRPKCHRIFYDSNINSAPVVRLNIYQSFLLCAMKFHCYISSLASIVRLSTNSYIDVLDTSLRYKFLKSCYI